MNRRGSFAQQYGLGAFGNQRTAFLGEHRKPFKNPAKLMGYEVVEKDR
jgi:hypothetical protein